MKKTPIKFLSFILWIIAGIFILPCVFIAGAFEKWASWGQEL